MTNLFRTVALAGAATVAIAATLVKADTASAQNVIICQSVDYQQVRCSINTRSRVILEQEYSRASCDGNWGYRSGYVWVRNGCRARFRTLRDGESRYDQPYYQGRPYPVYPRRPSYPYPRR